MENKKLRVSHTKRITLISVFLSFGVGLFILDEFLPRPLPFLKLGLGNIVNVIALYSLGFRDAIVIGLLRVILGSFISGKLFAPNFVISFVSALISIIFMGVVSLAGRRFISPLGVSISGAFAHNMTQLVVSSLFIAHSKAILFLAPYFAFLSLLTGGITGYIVALVYTPVLEFLLSDL